VPKEDPEPDQEGYADNRWRGQCGQVAEHGTLLSVRPLDRLASRPSGDQAVFRTYALSRIAKEPGSPPPGFRAARQAGSGALPQRRPPAAAEWQYPKTGGQRSAARKPQQTPDVPR
jgi:hypothetical protein